MPPFLFMVVDFTKDPSLFTDVFYDYQEAETRFVLIYGGTGSSKSYSVHQSELIDCLDRKTGEGDTIIFRKTRASIADSSFRLLKQLARDWGISNLFHWRESTQKMDITGPNGGQILFYGMDDPEKVKSLAGIKRIVLEEANQFTFEDFKELNRRARGFENIQIVLVFNPVDEGHWINKWFFENETAYKPRTTVLHYTYHVNRQNMTEEEVEEIENLKFIDPVDYDVYALGKWGVRSAVRPYASSYEDQKHISEEAIYVPGLPVIATLDFNLNPFVCELAHVFVDEDGPHVWVFDEIALENGSVPEMIDEIKLRVPEVHMLELTGDATQKKGDINRRDNADSWKLLRTSLKVTRSRFKVPTSNPNPRNNRTLLNLVLLHHPDVKISPKCTLLRRDLRSCEAADDGGILKKNRNNELQKADALDAFRYMVNVYLSWFTKSWQKYAA